MPPLALEAVRRRARTLDAKVRRRNHLEYAGAAFVLVLAGPVVATDSSLLVRVGAALLVLGGAFIAHHLHTHGSTQPMPADLGLRDSLAFQRAELERQRDLLRRVWRWYLLPFLPGTALILIGRAIERPDRRLLALGVAIVGAAFAFAIAKLNARGAERIQRLIDDLDPLR